MIQPRFRLSIVGSIIDRVTLPLSYAHMIWSVVGYIQIGYTTYGPRHTACKQGKQE